MLSLRNSLILLILIGLRPLLGWSQLQQKPVWDLKTSKTEVKAGEEIELIFTSKIQKDWYMYSNDFSGDVGPVVAFFDFAKHPSYQLVGKLKPVGNHKHFDDVFGGEVSTFVGKAEFRQKVKILKANPIIKVAVEFQECSQVTGMCVLFDDNLEFKNIKVTGAPVAATTQTVVAEPETTTPEKSVQTEAKDTTAAIAAAPSTPGNNNACDYKNMQVPNDSYIKDNGKKGDLDGSNESLLGFMIYAFLFGLGAIMTPCVFPMIPMTVTFFTKHQDHGRFKAFVFGLFIILIYTIVGTLVAIFMGPDFANWLSTHWLPNILFFLIFIVFAASFLGMFEITLPHGLVNSMDSKSSMSSYGGIFFMAFTMVLVSFSCTGPLVGNILIQAFGGTYLRPIAGMFAFSLAFAIPFTLFAIFPQWLSSLPKSGGWLNSVKVVLGFIELALAFKFLSTADTVYHWGLLNRDVYIAIWIVIAIMLGLYLMGKFMTAHDSPLASVSVPRLFLAIGSFSFAVYLFPGLFGAPLSAISGYLPPQHTLAFDLYTSKDNKNNINQEIKHEKLFHLPHNLKGFFDYCQALEYSKKANKPVFIDFTGHGCVNCRKMEANVWSNPDVLKMLNDDYIVVALYADEKESLPENEWYVSPYDNKEKKEIGKQNLDLQIRKFNANAQPLYVLIDGAENMLAYPRSYNESVPEFVEFLKKGKETYKKIHPQP
ncbi:MAG: disulfide bond formation protein DsbD [Bacteroidetes bacterium B1(2017)]|nr:MAG: disulfide bond formation protein DsbD [Bacteroidetes bacterium B1(2017)]